MIKLLLGFAAMTIVLGQEFEFIDNMVDFKGVPYESISLPYPYQGDRNSRIINIQSEARNDFKVRDGFELVELPAKLKAMKQVKTSLVSADTSIKSTLFQVVIKIFGFVKAALKKLLLKIPALALGAIVVIGFCKITSVCTKISSFQSLSEAHKEFNKIVTPERLDMATEFIQEAIRRYRSIQE